MFPKLTEDNQIFSFPTREALTVQLSTDRPNVAKQLVVYSHSVLISRHRAPLYNLCIKYILSVAAVFAVTAPDCRLLWEISPLPVVSQALEVEELRSVCCVVCMCVVCMYAVCVYGRAETGGYTEAALQLFSHSLLCEKWVRAAQHLLLVVDVGNQCTSHTVLQLTCAHSEGIFNLAVIFPLLFNMNTFAHEENTRCT